MTEYISYPPTLPLPQANFNGHVTSPIQTTSFSSGKIRRRKIGRVTVKEASLEWLFNPDEFDIWESFHRSEINDGCVPFVIDMCTGGSSQKGRHVVQCKEDYSFTYDECNWRVSVGCIIYPYPQDNGYKLLESYLGGGLSMLPLNKYYDERYQK